MAQIEVLKIGVCDDKMAQTNYVIRPPLYDIH